MMSKHTEGGWEVAEHVMEYKRGAREKLVDGIKKRQIGGVNKEADDTQWKRERVDLNSAEQ